MQENNQETSKKNFRPRKKLDNKERKEHYFKNFYTTDEENILKFANWKLKRKLINDIK